jgi:glycosyltransferase involved in cell wall biosynthesis
VKQVSAIRMEDLPAPPAGLSGWPWTGPLDAAPESPPGGRGEWPLITVVTPSLNQAHFLERTIRSVLSQNYPRLEYFVIDGGSRDGSREIVERYARHLAYWVSEPDRGYVHAINKGLSRANGEILCWLNSDDFYLPGTLRFVAEQLSAPAGAHAAVVGHVLKVYADGRPPEKLEGRYEGLERLLKFWLGYRMHQPSIFWRREVLEAVGLPDESKDLAADFDYWVKIARRFSFTNVDRVLACATYHERAKTGDNYRRYHEALKAHAPRHWRREFRPRSLLLEASMLNHYVLRPSLRTLFRPFDYVRSATRRRLRA